MRPRCGKLPAAGLGSGRRAYAQEHGRLPLPSYGRPDRSAKAEAGSSGRRSLNGPYTSSNRRKNIPCCKESPPKRWKRRRRVEDVTSRSKPAQSVLDAVLRPEPATRQAKWVEKRFQDDGVKKRDAPRRKRRHGRQGKCLSCAGRPAYLAQFWTDVAGADEKIF